MKIAITASNNSLESEISPLFNTADYFLIFDPDIPENFEAIKNPHSKQQACSEIFGAQLIMNYDVNAIMTGRCTPNASRIFHAAGIQVIDKVEGRVKQYIPLLKTQLLEND